MSAAVSTRQKRLLRSLLNTGRWKSEREIIRYGLSLVAKEIECEYQRNLDPYPAGVLSAAYRKLGKKAMAEDRAMAKASAYPSRGELG